MVRRTFLWIAAGLFGALLVAAGTAVAQDRGRSRDGREGSRLDRFHRFLRERAGERGRAGRLARFQRLMDASDDQVRVALDASREAAKVREDLKAKAAAIVVAAFREAKDAAPEQKSQIRERTKAEIRTLRQGARGPLTEAGRKALAALTPEQRKRMDEAIKDRGLSFDEDRLALMFGMRLAHPRAEALLRARLAR